MHKTALDGYLILAPMAELTHGGFRRLTNAFGGPDLYFSEMISAGALVATSPYEKWYLDDGPDCRSLVYQIVGDNEEKIVRAASIAAENNPYGIDINMGCSISHIVKRGWGISWMEDRTKASALIRVLRRTLDKKIMLSAKFRIGQNEDYTHLSEFGRSLCDAGADYLTLHAKTAGTPVSRPANQEYYFKLQEELEIPLVYNGMIGLGQSSDGVFTGRPNAPLMIGRAAVKQPWIFAMQKGMEIKLDMVQTARLFITLVKEHQPEDFWLTRTLRFFSWFCQNLFYGHKLFSALNQETNIVKILELFVAYFDRNPQELAIKKTII